MKHFLVNTPYLLCKSMAFAFSIALLSGCQVVQFFDHPIPVMPPQDETASNVDSSPSQ